MLIQVEPKELDSNVDKIMGGTDAGKYDYPFQVHLEYKSDPPSTYNCGGFIISPLLILTAAHCVFGKNSVNFRVTAGDHTKSEIEGNEQVRNVSRFYIHENYVPGEGDNDIALLVLISAFNLNDYVNNVSYNYNDQPVNWTGEGTVTGWGLLDRFEKEGHHTLQKLHVPIVSNSECKKSWKNALKPTTTWMCAGKAGVDSCQGDSGGPLSGYLASTGKRFVVGLVQGGQPCFPSTHKKPGRYTNISKFIPWINEMIDRSTTPEIRCKEDEFRCHDGQACIRWPSVCECAARCSDRSDHYNATCQMKKKGGPKCFPPFVRVSLSDGTLKKVSDLTPIDELIAIKYPEGKSLQETARVNSSFQTYLHKNHLKKVLFLAMQFSNGKQLVVSREHLLFAYDEKLQQLVPKMAEDFKVNEDKMIYFDENGNLTRPILIKVRVEKYQGIYAPLTFDGTFIADGFLVSCYADVNSFQLAHYAMAPLRLWSYLKNTFIKNDRNQPAEIPQFTTDDELHPYSIFLMRLRFLNKIWSNFVTLTGYSTIVLLVGPMIIKLF